jgi:hypothetical protein
MTQAWNDSANQKVIIDKNEITESFKKHFFNAELKEEAVGDLVAEIIFKKFVEQTSQAAYNQIQQEQIPALPTEQIKPRDTKKEKYVA